MRRIESVLLLFGLQLGCATIFGGGPQQLHIRSEPPGATYQYGALRGQTPDTVHVPRKELGSGVLLTKPGYHSASVPVSSRLRGIVWLNLLFWPGFIVDFVTGNAYQADPAEVVAVLTHEEGGELTEVSDRTTEAEPPDPAAPAGPGAAREHHKRARRLYDLGRFDEAYDAWASAYQADPRPEFLFNMGNSKQRQGTLKADPKSLRQAIHLLRRFRQSEGVDGSQRADADQTITEIEAQLRRLER